MGAVDEFNAFNKMIAGEAAESLGTPDQLKEMISGLGFNSDHPGFHVLSSNCGTIFGLASEYFTLPHFYRTLDIVRDMMKNETLESEAAVDRAVDAVVDLMGVPVLINDREVMAKKTDDMEQARDMADFIVGEVSHLYASLYRFHRECDELEPSVIDKDTRALLGFLAKGIFELAAKWRPLLRPAADGG